MKSEEVEIVQCPNSASDWSPCLAREGSTILSTNQVCRGCGLPPLVLIGDLLKKVEVNPERAAIQADMFKAMVAVYVEYQK